MSNQQEQERMEDATEGGNMAVRIAVPEFVADKQEPFSNDLLSRGQRVRLLCDFAKSVSDHAVIAVDGGWGTGKSALLRMCRAYLEQREVRVAEFNAWTEGYTSDPVFNLASALTEVMEEGQAAKLLEAAKVVGMAAVKNLPFKIGDMVTDAAEAIAQDQAFPNGLPEYRERVRAFKEALEQEAGKDDGPLVVLVDELDRCLPHQVVKYLVAVHNLLSVRGVVVVLGINLEEAANGLKAVYGSAYGSERYLQRFFELRMNLSSTMGSDDLSSLINHLREHLGIEVEADASRGYIDGLLATTARASGVALRPDHPEPSTDAAATTSARAPCVALRDLQRVAQALRWTMATGLDSGRSGRIDSPDAYAKCVTAALVLLTLRHLDPEGYWLFTEAKASTHSAMLQLSSQLMVAERESAYTAIEMAMYFDSIAAATGGQQVTEEQFQEMADLYSLQDRRDDYSNYCISRRRIMQYLNPQTAQMVLAAVEMTTE